ncbi:MAG: FTR1 family protein, partial [Acidimicrobiales bacterium]|nr:FTR1 family protein [Acidimicrobiales bacterium]
EASMIVAILLAYLDRAGHRRYFRDVFIGVGAALVLASAGGVAAYLTVRTYAGSRAETIFETVTYVVAAAVLTYMTFWMRNHGRTMSSELRARAEAALGRGARAGLSVLAFQAVGREGLETVVFTLAIVFAASPGHVLAGGAVGLAAAALVACLVYRLGKQLNLRMFFTTVGALLMVFAAGLLVDAVQNLQELGWLPFLRQPLWDTAGLLSEDSTFGDIVHSFFGYASRPTVLQAVVYVVYLAVVLSTFTGLVRRRRPPRAAVARTRSASRPPVIAPSAGPR